MKRWLLVTFAVLVVLMVLYGVYAAVVSPSQGRARVGIALGTYSDGSMYMTCLSAESDPGVCDSMDPTIIHLKERDRATFTVHNQDGGRHTHDFRMKGWSYFLPPAR